MHGLRGRRAARPAGPHGLRRQPGLRTRGGGDRNDYGDYGCLGVAGPALSRQSSSSPRRCATAAASPRLATASFAMIRDTCTLAVFGEM